MVPYPVTTPSPGNLLLGHPKVIASVENKFIHLLKAAFVKEIMNPLSGSHLAFGMLLVYSFLAASQLCFLILLSNSPILSSMSMQGLQSTHLLSD